MCGHSPGLLEVLRIDIQYWCVWRGGSLLLLWVVSGFEG